jgi:hypothetical protein
MTNRRMGLNAVIFGLGSHEAGWRMPESDPLASTNLDYWIDIAQRAEAGGFEALFLGDVLALQQSADRHLSDAMDPIVILSALAAVTERIGLIGTAKNLAAAGSVEGGLAALDHQRLCNRAAGSACGQCGATCRPALAI